MAKIMLLSMITIRMIFLWTNLLVCYSNRLSETAFEYDCIHYEILNDRLLYKVESTGVSQITQYCIRPSYNLDDHPFVIETHKLRRSFKNFTFEELYLKRNMTADDIIRTTRYKSIAAIERYAIYLETLNESMSQELLYRCEDSSWFGSECQYLWNPQSLIQMTVQSADLDFSGDVILTRSSNISVLEMTCYTHLICNRGPPPACLDWREICDGKIDCANDNGIDERFCEHFELLECANNEYRCQNGRQCIHRDFYRDDPLDPDCQDGSDEIVSNSIVSLTYPHECDRDPTFRCEERTCTLNKLACGDGQCVEYFHECNNHRGQLLMMEFGIYKEHNSLSSCQSLPFSCGTHIENVAECQPSCWNKKIVLCEARLGQLCASTVFKHSPSLFRPNHDMYIFYNYNQVPSKRSWVLVPHDKCFNDTHCHNTELNLDNPALLWCQRNRVQMHLSYVGSYSRKDFTATIQRLTKECYKNFTDSKTRQELPHQNEKTGESTFKQAQLSKIRNYNIDGTNLYDVSSLLNDQNQVKPTSEGKGMRMITVFNNFRNIPVKRNWSDDFPFFEICDRTENLNAIDIDGINQTDETECDHWPCNNIYTRCDGHTHCRDGADELNCELLRCLDNDVLCVSVDSRKIECMPQNRILNSKVDCIGGTDEYMKCGLSSDLMQQEFLCSSYDKCIDVRSVCNGIVDCAGGEDEYLCDSFPLTIILSMLHCGYSSEFIYEHSREISCSGMYFKKITFLSLMNLVAYPPFNSINLIKNRALKLSDENKSLPKQSVVPRNILKNLQENADHRCHRGLDAYMVTSFGKNLFELKCFCPPSYYGNRCQYQSDRVSLTLQMRFSVNRQNAFVFLITLIDEKRNINSFFIHKHRPSEDCDKKYNFYLLYSTPMKDKKKNYSIHIDLFKEGGLSYYTSWYLPIYYPFLPVSRITTVLKIPMEPNLPQKSRHCTFQCQHGQCIKYVNTEKHFCQCESGWYGLLCDMRQPCDCSLDSRCMGSANGRPICICFSHKYGPRCLFNSPCQEELCENGGTCIPLTDERGGKRSIDYRCVCRNEFEGKICDKRKTNVSFRFVGIQVYSFMIIHILSTFTAESHTEIVTFQKLRINSNTGEIFISTEIHINLLFVQFDRKYYLAVVQDSNIQLSNISTVVSVERQCHHVNDLLSLTARQSHPLKRLIQYPRLCRERTGLVCFHDERLMCLCTKDQFSNCFEFNFKKNVTCQNENPCEKEGRCFEDRPNCPSIVECICSECYYGTRCQFSTIGLGVSLDAMLGYEIQPMNSLSEQPISVKVSAIITMIMFMLGLISSTMSIITFGQTRSHEVGCSKYLLALSIASLLTMIMFALKFWFFLFAQMSIITDSIFLYVNCLLMDVSTKVCLSTTNWLGACVAIERTVSAMQQIRFNKKKSKQIATWVILILIFCIILTHLSDPLHRVVLDDDSEQRKWCIVRYPLSIEKFDSINLFLHFVVPFAINAISAVMIIVLKTRSVFTIKKQQSYLEHLLKQIHQFRHLLISPCVLVLLSVPRLILAFLPGCMKSTEDLWIYLAGYFVSFVPSLLIFPIFVLPSNVYRKEFSNQSKRIFKTIASLYLRHQ